MRVIFALDCCDREAIRRAATTGGYIGHMVCDVVLHAVENRFNDALNANGENEWHNDKGCSYVADETLTFSKKISLKSVTTPVRSPQRNVMAENFVVSWTPKPAVGTAPQNLAIAFDHDNESHPHSALKNYSPREFRQ